MSPRRIQQQRTKGWRKPAGAVAVHRNTQFGNPFWMQDLPPGGDPAENRALLVNLFREMLDDPEMRKKAGYPHDDFIRATLAGKDLMCWCKLDYPCHADVLLEIANRPAPSADEHVRRVMFPKRGR